MNRRRPTIENGLPPHESTLSLQPSTLSLIRRNLLAWFGRNQRDLPWRADRDPYRIWISEVMLQQTQVATVIPYFHRFLEAFPTLQQLAAADEQEVLKLWEGLGYYRRARDLHRAARILVSNHAGQFPDDPQVWGDLPGVGRYILGAVLSQAFDRPMPIVEANSKRVLCRLFGQEGDVKSSATVNWLWHTAETLLPRKRSGDFNQSLMELGALICTPASPRCSECPVSPACVAFRDKKQAIIPAVNQTEVTEAVCEVAVVVSKGSRVLLLQRPSTGRWSNMWEFPRVALEKKETIRAGALRVLRDMIGIRADLGDELLTVRHSVTRFRITLTSLAANYRSGKVQRTYYQNARWLSAIQLRDYPVSKPQRLLADEVARRHTK